MNGYYNPTLVILSILVAVLAGYTALDLASSLVATRGRARLAWLAGGSLALGIGIWSMHFVGMLAFGVPGLTIGYDAPGLAASVLVAVAASAAALHVAGREQVGTSRFMLAGAFMGLAIAGMHYLGIGAMRLAAPLTWSPLRAALALAVAFGASFGALALALRSRRESGGWGFAWRLGGGIALGGAIAGVHYLAMAAVRLAPAASPATGSARGALVVATPGLALAVVGATILVLGIAVLGSIMERALAARTAWARESTQLYELSKIARADAERRAREEAALREVAGVLVAAGSAEEVARGAVQGALTVASAEAAYLERLSGDTREVEIVATAGTGAPSVGLRVPFPGSLSEEVIRRGEAEVVDDVGAWQRRPSGRHVQEACGHCRALAVPLVAEGESLGALVVLRSGEAVAFELDEVDRMRTLADMASLALRRLLTLDQAERRRVELEESESRFRELAENIREVFWVSEPGLQRMLYVSPAYEEISGRTTESLYADPRSFLEMIVPQDRAAVERAFDGPGAEEVDVEYRLFRPDGALRWIWARAFPIRDGAGSVVRIVGIAEDVTERREAEEAQRYLAEAGRVLASSLDHESTLQAVARLAVPAIADWCAVDVVEDGHIRRLAVAHRDPEMTRVGQELGREHPPDLESEVGIAQVLRTGEPAVLATIPDDVLTTVAGSDAHREALLSLGLRSAMLVPMTARGRILGAITLLTAESGRRYDPSDLAFAEQLAARAALAIDNARLFRDAEAAREQATSILERITEAFFAVDRGWRLVYLNGDARELLGGLKGADPSAMLGRTFWDVVPEIRGTRFEMEYRRALEQQRPAHFEEYFPQWHVWFEVHAYPSPEGLSVFFRDITERKRSEQGMRLLAEVGAVLASSLDYQETLAGVAQLATRHFADTCIVDLLEGGATLRMASIPTGQPGSEQIQRLSHFSLAPDSPVATPLRSGEPLLLAGLTDDDLRALAVSEAHLALMRQVRPRSVLSVPLLARGHALGVMSFVMSSSGRRFGPDDVPLAQELARRSAAAVDNARLFDEAQRRAREEAALREAAAAVAAPFSIDEMVEQIARGALTATGADGAYVARIDAEAGELVTAATAGLRRPVLGSRVPFTDSYAEEALAHGRPLLVRRLAEASRPFLGGLADKCGDCAAVLVPLADGENRIGVLVVVREPERPAFSEDEVRRAHTFGQLAGLAFRKVQLLGEAEQRRDQLERVVESRARLMRGFSHDLKNPLGAADGYAQLLEEGIITDPAKQRESLARIRSSISAALRLIEDLLELARAEAGQLEVRTEPLDVGLIARELANEYGAQAEAAGLELALEPIAPLPVIPSDEHRVRQVLGNLLSNAVKYTPSGGRIGVRVEVRDAGLAGQPAVALDIWDTGPGIAPERRDDIFREFTRLDPRAKSGAGLGLAISRRIARALGGDLTVDERAGGGSVFTLWLPVAAGSVTKRATPGHRAA